MITSLLAAADWADFADEGELANYLRETADIWNACIEGWLYVRGTETAKQVGVDGYYARILPPESIEPPYACKQQVELLDCDAGEQDIPAHEVISVDALALVRFGLRAPDDPRILNTLKVIDAKLKLQTERGAIWHRYTADRFGEHDDGSPFETKRKGKGRAWPLLIGERAHYELARGNCEKVSELIAAMAAYAGEAGLISEQVWDTDDLPEKGLIRGRPSGSASPLVWAHSEYLKLLRSVRDKAVFDCPPQCDRLVAKRSGQHKPNNTLSLWRIDHPVSTIPLGTGLRIEAAADIEVQWRIDGDEPRSLADAASFLGVRFVDLPADKLALGSCISIVTTVKEADASLRSQEHYVHVR